jgi:cytochrome c peroxidase
VLQKLQIMNKLFKGLFSAHSMKPYCLIAISLFIIYFSSCSKDIEAVSPSATPVSLEHPTYFGSPSIPQNNPTTKEGVLLGRMLFYEKKLSGNNTMSCGSCHRQKFAFSDSSAFSKGIDGVNGQRSTMALSNLAWQGKFFWDGRANNLEEQVPSPIQNPIEMHENISNAIHKLQATSTYPPLFKAAFGSQTISTENISKAIAQFERTLISSNSRYDQFRSGNPAALNNQEKSGYLLFFTHPVPASNLRGGNCGDCHSGDLQQNKTFQNNGIDSVYSDLGLAAISGNSNDSAKFKVPSLRNIALTAPYMHDGRFNTLQEVLDHYNAHVNGKAKFFSPLMMASNTGGGTQLDLTPQEIADIIAFLNTLTDTAFTTDPAFSDPH